MAPLLRLWVMKGDGENLSWTWTYRSAGAGSHDSAERKASAGCARQYLTRGNSHRGHRSIKDTIKSFSFKKSTITTHLSYPTTISPLSNLEPASLRFYPRFSSHCLHDPLCLVPSPNSLPGLVLSLVLSPELSKCRNPLLLFGNEAHHQGRRASGCSQITA